ncbi:hypothetical protein BDD43_4170 [Mucilaginibacter gracilis]|uniref:Uncharacterized protein n=1 Tax=Mucilaginibacter gracilis TaxID=423350 RepID=A0A495J4Q7_9SPHI|nr:hypothetical protein BDD43_4170 [Mucilaginibacter gracilis]
MGGILVIFLIFASPIGQTVLVSKRLRGNIQTSIMSITLLAMLSTIILSLIGLVPICS